MPFRRPPVRGLLVVPLLLVGTLFLSACNLTTPMSTLDTYGNHAQNIYDLLVPVFWAAIAVFIVVEGILLYSVIRFRRRPNSGIPAQIHGNLRIEVLWTIVPALIVLVIAVLTFQTQRANATIPEDALTVRAIGHQWWFEFQYPDPANPENMLIVTANDMYIPVGRDVVVELEATDVIHNFWVPKLAGKVYMYPADPRAPNPNLNRLPFRAEEPGIFRAQCAEFCGEAHAQMGFRVIALPGDEYDAWVANRQVAPPLDVDPATVALPGDPENGRLLFTQRACIGCHVVEGNDQAVGLNGPNLTYFANRTTIAAGVLPNTPENLTAWLDDPERIKPGNKMSGQYPQLNSQELADLVAYLYSQELEIDLPEPR